MQKEEMTEGIQMGEKEGLSGRQGYILRQGCLAQLEALQEKPVVKLLTGIRGSGKTTILAAFAEGFRQKGIPSEQIVELNFDDFCPFFEFVRLGYDLY